MTNGTLALALAGLLAAAAAPAQAGSVNCRERHQERRIAQGVRSGELTRREAARLQAQQARLRAEEFRDRHDDGRLGPRERADLQRDLNRTSRHIYGQKHDEQERP